MFIDETAFDVDDVDAKYSKSRNNSNSGAKHSGDLQVSDFDSDQEGFGSGGVITQSSSRARVLAQQRELQLRRRQSQMQNTGMIRSSLDNGFEEPSRTSNQRTPAMPQFSAPKSTAPDQEQQGRTEFMRPAKPVSNSRVLSRRDNTLGDDEDEDEPNPRKLAPRPPAAKRSEYVDDEPKRPTRQTAREDDDVKTSPNKQRRDQAARGAVDDRDREPTGRRPKRREAEEEQWTNATDNVPADSKRSAEILDIPQAMNPSAHEAKATVPLNLSNMKSFLTSPVPKDAGIVMCNIKRNESGLNSLFPLYTLELKDGGVFLLQSKKQAQNTTSNYHITMAENDFSKDSVNFLGKLRSNFLGTEFQVFDNGIKDSKEAAAANVLGLNSNIRKEIAGVLYAANVLGSRGPRKMQVAVPVVDDKGNAAVYKAGVVNNTSELVTRMKDRNYDKLCYMINKPPRWNDAVGAYVLNFNGRVTMASVKNFQLVDPADTNAVLLQFGRVGKDEFTMDLQWPLSPLQAFGITLSSFDSKFACD